MDGFVQIFFLLAIIPSAIIHEYMHGWVANELGDPTAKYAGRLSLDPRVHVDLFGTLLLPFMLFLLSSGQWLFAYAKPVPFNPYNLKDQKWGPVWVALAGPFSNLVLAFVFGMFVKVFTVGTLPAFFFVVVLANVLLAVFNMIPIPPLDGSKLLFALMPDSMAHYKEQLQRYGFWIILALVFVFPNAYSGFISPIMGFFVELFTGVRAF